MMNECQYYAMEEAANMDNSAIEDAASVWGADSPAELSRILYDDTDCGVTLGLCFQYEEEDASDHLPVVVNKWFWSDDLAQFGDWKNIASMGYLITGVALSTIVEGSDAEFEGYIDADLQDITGDDLAVKIADACIYLECHVDEWIAENRDNGEVDYCDNTGWSPNY